MCSLLYVRWWKSKRRISNLLNFLSLHLPTKYFHVVQRHWKMNWLVHSCKSLRCSTQKKREKWNLTIFHSQMNEQEWWWRNSPFWLLFTSCIWGFRSMTSRLDIMLINVLKKALESWFQCERVKGKRTEFKHKLTRVGASNNFVVLVRRKQLPFFSCKLSPEHFWLIRRRCVYFCWIIFVIGSLMAWVKAFCLPILYIYVKMNIFHVWLLTDHTRSWCIRKKVLEN